MIINNYIMKIMEWKHEYSVIYKFGKHNKILVLISPLNPGKKKKKKLQVILCCFETYFSNYFVLIFVL